MRSSVSARRDARNAAVAAELTRSLSWLPRRSIALQASARAAVVDARGRRVAPGGRR